MTAALMNRSSQPAFATDQYRLADWLLTLDEEDEAERRDAAGYDPTLPAANID